MVRFQIGLGHAYLKEQGKVEKLVDALAKELEKQGREKVDVITRPENGQLWEVTAKVTGPKVKRARRMRA